MTIYEALYRSIKELMPTDFDIVFNNLDENSEQCGLGFKGTGAGNIRHLDGSIGNRSMRLVVNYNTKDVFAGFDYGERIVEKLTNSFNIGYRDDESGELLVYISNIKLLGNINYLGKNKNNSINCFSINFIITYGKI